MKLIEQCTRDMTHTAPETAPVIGREQELEALLSILCRKHKNNPALVGEPGVQRSL